MVVRDVRQIIDKNFEPSTIEIENVVLGDLPSKTIQEVIQDRGYSAPDRSEITTTVPIDRED